MAVQRESGERQVIRALEKPDPIAGVGDFPGAFKVLDALAMFDILNTLFRLQKGGQFTLLQVHLGEASGVDGKRLRAAFEAITEKAGGSTPQQFAERHTDSWSGLPVDQQKDVTNFLDPTWSSKIPIEDIPSASDEALGPEYVRGLNGDPERLKIVEDELQKRADDPKGWGTAAPPAVASQPGTTAVTPDVAIKILENYAKGEAPFKPELGKGGASWFVTEGNPYVGIGADKTISVNAELTSGKGALKFAEAELLEIFERERKATEAEAEAKFREHNKIPPEKPLTSRLQKALDRPNGFKDKFAESRMWDRVGEAVASSKSKVGEVLLEGSRFSRQGNGKFLVVADASKVKLKGGPGQILGQLESQGLGAEPVLVEAAEAMAARLKWVGRVRFVTRWGGRILIVVALVGEGIKIYYAKDKTKAVLESLVGWAAATAAGAAFAAWWTPADVAGPWAWVGHGVGTLVVGGIGYWVGSSTMRTIYELVVED